MTSQCVVNGRYLLRQPTGVEVVANELVCRLHCEGHLPALDVLVPQGDAASPLPPQGMRQSGWFSGHAWEQIDLPRAAAGRPILNFCNTGPVCLRNQLVTIHDAQFRTVPQSYGRAFRSFYRALLPAIGHRARIVATVSNASLLALRRHGVVPPDKGEVVPNGADRLARHTADAAVFSQLGLSERGYFIAVGSAAPHKNLALLIDVFEAMPPGTPPLVVVGGANPRIFAKERTARMPCVKPVGRVTDAQLKALYAGALALLFPSLDEGFGLPPLEAMHAGTLAIVSDRGGIPEACGDAAIYAPPDDPAAWVGAIAAVTADPHLHEEYRGRGSERAARMTWSRTTAAYADLIKGELLR